MHYSTYRSRPRRRQHCSRGHPDYQLRASGAGAQPDIAIRPKQEKAKVVKRSHDHRSLRNRWPGVLLRAIERPTRRRVRSRARLRLRYPVHSAGNFTGRGADCGPVAPDIENLVPGDTEPPPDAWMLLTAMQWPAPSQSPSLRGGESRVAPSFHYCLGESLAVPTRFLRSVNGSHRQP